MIRFDEFVHEIIRPPALIGGNIPDSAEKYRVVLIRDLPDFGYIRTYDVRGVPKTKITEKSLLRRNDVIVSLYGHVGKAGIVSAEIEGAICGHTQAILRFKDRKAQNAKTLYLLLQTRAITQYFAGLREQLPNRGRMARVADLGAMPIPAVSDESRQLGSRLFDKMDKLLEDYKQLRDMIENIFPG